MHTSGISYDALSTAQRNLLVNPNSGLTIYNKDNGQLEINLGSPSVPVWQAVVPVSPDTNTVNFPNVAFVGTDGNDLTAVVGDANKPYLNIGTAMDNANIVVIKPGTYSFNIQFTSTRDNRHVICMDGVTFTSGGVYVYSGTTNVKFTGRAVMNGNFYNGLQVNTTDPVNIEFECAKMELARTVCWTPPGAQAKIRFTTDSIRCTGVNGGGYSVRMYGTAEAEFNIKYFYESQYAAFHGRSGFSGKLTVNCPKTITVNPITSNPYGNLAKNVLWLDSVLGAEIVFNGDCLDEYSVNRNGGVINAANLTNALLYPTVTINGQIRSANTQGVYLWYRASRGNFIFNVDIINKCITPGSQCVPVWTQLTGWGSPADQKIIIRGNIEATGRSVIGSGKKLYIYSPFIYNADISASGGLFFKSGAGGQQSEIYIYNSKMELGNAPGTSEIILGDASLASDIVATTNTRGTEPAISTVAIDAWAGYTQLIGLITPKI